MQRIYITQREYFVMGLALPVLNNKRFETGFTQSLRSIPLKAGFAR